MQYVLDEEGLHTPTGLIDPLTVRAARIDRVHEGERYDSEPSGSSYGRTVGGAVIGGVLAGGAGALAGAVIGSSTGSYGSDDDVHIPRTVSATMVIETGSEPISVDVPLDQTGHAEEFVAALRKAAGIKR
jgi:hypothetical protein